MATSTSSRRQIGAVRKLASAVTLGYLRRVPIERGKWRLMRLANSFLVCQIEPGLFVRLSGLSHVEVKLFRDGVFEQETLAAFAELLEPGMTVLDLGANIGLYTLVAANRVGP
ncbi:MAG TPA: hypothetical protein VGZ22_09790, partial [Isosphaeraceae bacterium]|nr:hypothetical protein [Isosphaeraceae bacterium]